MGNSSENDFTIDGLPEATSTSISTQQQRSITVAASLSVEPSSLNDATHHLRVQQMHPPPPHDFSRYRLSVSQPPEANRNVLEEDNDHGVVLVNHESSQLQQRLPSSESFDVHHVPMELTTPHVSKMETSECEHNFEKQQRHKMDEDVVDNVEERIKEEMVEMEEEQTPGKIRSMDQQSIQRIVAGQAVTDLASAVKELVDNALDASSQNINSTFSHFFWFITIQN